MGTSQPPNLPSSLGIFGCAKNQISSPQTRTVVSTEGLSSRRTILRYYGAARQVICLPVQCWKWDLAIVVLTRLK